MIKEQIPYGLEKVTIAALTGLESWNITGKERFDLPVGTRIHINHVSDASSTVVTTVNTMSVAIPHPDNGNAYRFIVPNLELGKALGMDLPEKTKDLVGDIIAFESGEMDEDEAREFLTDLKETGLAYRLQGSYGRAIAALGI
jgi:hypothetical protein